MNIFIWCLSLYLCACSCLSLFRSGNQALALAWLLYRSILSLRAFQTIYWAKCEFAWSCWQIRWKIVRVTLVYSGCIYQRKSWAQDQDLVTPLISPNPAPDHIADFHLFLNIVRLDLNDGSLPFHRPMVSHRSGLCQINYQGRGQCSTESFLLYNYLEEKDFLNYPKSPKSKHELLKNTHITFIVLKYWFLSVFLGMVHCVLWRCRHKPGATFNYDIITEAEAALEKLNFKDLWILNFDFSFGQKMSIVVNIGSDIKICVDFGLKGLLDFTARG